MLQVPLDSPWVRRVRPGGLLLTITCIALLALAAVMTFSFLALAIDKGGTWLGFIIALAFTAGLVFALVLQRRARARILAAVASADLSQPVRADITFVDQTLRYSNFRYHHYLDLRCSIEVSPLPIFGVGQEARFGVGANVLPSNILADGGSTLFLVPLPDTGPGNPLFLARTQTLDWFLLRRI